jgi:rRNA-processing protein FCF1
MSNAIKYIKDETGQKTSVLVPVKVWDDLNTNFKKLRKKFKVMNDIQQALTEVHNARKSGRELKSLKDFLRESKR